MPWWSHEKRRFCRSSDWGLSPIAVWPWPCGALRCLSVNLGKLYQPRDTNPNKIMCAKYLVPPSFPFEFPRGIHFLLAGEKICTFCIYFYCAYMNTLVVFWFMSVAWYLLASNVSNSLSCQKATFRYLCSHVWSESQGCPLQVSKGLLDRARNANLVQIFYNQSWVYSWVRCLSMSDCQDCLFFVDFFFPPFFFFFLAVLCSMQILVPHA